MKSENIILEKSFQFASHIILLYKRLIAESDNRVLPTQLLKSGTSIGANIREAVRSQSRNEFLAKMNIALKEANESDYWLRLLFRTNFLDETQFNSLESDIREVISLLTAICKTSDEK